MDFFYTSSPKTNLISTLHTEPYPRLLHTALPVRTIGYLPAKKDTIRHSFNTCNFSIILKGTGIYRFRGGDMRVSAPCVLTQWPGEPMHYGPDSEWEELFFIYTGSLTGSLHSRGLFNPADPVWFFKPTSTMQNLLERLNRNIALAEQPGTADRIDHLCEAIILETRLGRIPAPLAADERLVREMETALRREYADPGSLERIPRSHGLHPAAFRRLWNKFIPVTPAAYVAQLRMAEARRLLVETDMHIGEIAHAVGYDDELYFYRKFRKTFGVTAGEYRRQRLKDVSMQY